jgi:hypothetical protein
MNGTRRSFGLEAMFGLMVLALAPAAIGCAGGCGVDNAAQTALGTYGGALVQGVQGEWKGDEAARAALTIPRPVGRGHVLLACAEWSAPGDAQVAVSDTGAHVWHALRASAQVDPATRCWFATNYAEETTTVSYAVARATYVRGFVHDYAGAAANEATKTRNTAAVAMR